jgi:hypothetical protein
MTTFVTLLVPQYYVGMFISFPLPLIASFWIDFNPDPMRKASQVQKGFIAYNACLMALSHYSIYPWLVYSLAVQIPSGWYPTWTSLILIMTPFTYQVSG